MPGVRFVPPQLKMRQRNNAEEKFLVRKLTDIESGYRLVNGKLITEITDLNKTLAELDRDGGDHCLQYFDLPSEKTFRDEQGSLQFNCDPAVSVSCRPINSRINTGLQNVNKPRAKEIRSGVVQAETPRSGQNTLQTRTKCLYAPSVREITCRHFPCATPRGYNSIGFQITRPSYPARQRGSIRTAETDDNTELPGWKDMSRPEEPSKTEDPAARKFSREEKGAIPKLSTRAKVLVLKQVLDERKRKLKERQPKPWETNYGNRVPLRQLQNPVRPVPSDVEAGLHSLT